MNPLEKEFAPYQESLELKELGFDEPCFGSWETDYVKLPTYTHSISGFYKNSNHPIGKVTAPTFSQAFRWFREKYKLIGLVQRDITRNYNGWWFKILSQIEEKDNPILLYSEDFNKDTYEEAELACLKKLIEIVKQ